MNETQWKTSLGVRKNQLAAVKKEIVEYRLSTSFTGILGFFALASLIDRPVKSVYYPVLMKKEVRDVLNRKVIGDAVSDGYMVYILWTMSEARRQTTNHFVPIVQ